MERFSPRLRRIFGFSAGAALVSLLLLSAGEVFLRNFPPPDFRPYLGDASGLRGPFRPDPVFGVQYRSWEAFEAEYAERLASYRHLFKPPSARCWAMFGNSFVQMQGMLADTTRARLPSRPVFNLARNEHPLVRAAQVDLLLARGLRPERIFFVLVPLDAMPFAKHAIDQTHVTPEGGLAYRPRLSGGPLDFALANSRLALLAWVRAARHQAVPGFNPSSLNHGLAPCVRADMRCLMQALADTGRRHRVPVTVVLIPNHEQITRGAAFGFQDAVAPACREAGLDVCDVRSAFLAADDKPGLFIPDKHFSDRGNHVLLDAVLSHLGGAAAGGPAIAHKGARP